MSKLPVVRGPSASRHSVESALKYIDNAAVTSFWFANLRQRKPLFPITKELDRGTLRAIIRQTGLTVEEFVALL